LKSANLYVAYFYIKEKIESIISNTTYQLSIRPQMISYINHVYLILITKHYKPFIHLDSFPIKYYTLQSPGGIIHLL